ncbi:dynamin GTPase [Fragilariopsis cylindrus CCMP1102]|uniref:Dynamin GTPase n=1 Tax=Fragilariopsis cylindrus CCMP1102 TaxID=635003 RepID=A0A1E7FSP3_9STRA|nr:dynamin GTPase [Fragilariopsis cylindrus CCMP1102]|eukprot:OEU21105.1 dynamin GTPase [Fragilariopsis cylindrus CCMP1102]
MEQLIPIASKLQDVLGAVGQNTQLDLPQIVVVGGQSSGKSSVLEGIVGRSFLPRGTGIVTRRPLILTLVNTRTPGYEHSQESSENQDPNSDSDDVGVEWGEFVHMPGRKFHSFQQIRVEIVRETDRLTGSNKGISNDPISLKIYSPHVLALTLVDLPGITKVPVGDQPENIEEQIQEMLLEFISNPNAIILAVTAANTDVANSDALRMAKAVDPYGNRTIGVLTKCDLMDPGTDASDVLLNRVYPLRRGYIGTVNRGQKDINEDLSIRDGLSKEEQFFSNHPVYSTDRNLMEKCGTKILAKNLNNILMHHIRDVLPDVKNRITTMMTDVTLELDALGVPGQKSRNTLGGTLLGLLSKFATNFASIIDGKALVELFGGARINYIFNDIFSTSLMTVGPFDGLTDEEVRTTITNAMGTRRALFVPEIAFDILIRRQIARLESPGIECVDLVYEELQRIAGQSEPKELNRFPFLRERLCDVVSNLLKRCMSPTQMMVENLVKIELAYINTSHPDFIGGARAVAAVTNRSVNLQPIRTSELPEGSTSETPTSQATNSQFFNAEGENEGEQTPYGPPTIVHLPSVPTTMKQTDIPPSDRELSEMHVIKSLIESYFKVVRKTFIDMVPKTIMFFLVNHVKDALQNELVSELYRESEVETLMKEADDVAQRRQNCEEMRDLLGKALEIVNEVRDFNTFSQVE